MGRFLVIGDIHGGLKALTQVIEKANVTTEDVLLFLGDYVDGWCESHELVEYLIKLSDTHECIFLRGNHDAWCEEYLTFGIEPNISHNTKWSEMGGLSTMNSYIRNDFTNGGDHLTFFRGLHPYYYDMHDNTVFVHGGYTSPNGVGEGNSARDYMWDRQLLDIANTHHNKNSFNSEQYHRNYPKILDVHKEIFIGHTTTQAYGTIKPLHVCNLINLDTGAGHGEGKLTMMDAKTKKYWQSDKLKELYPDDPQLEFHKGLYDYL